MRTISGIIVLVLLATGCATTRPTKQNEWRLVDGAWVSSDEADRKMCHDATSTMTVSTGRKVAIYATNILVIPVSTALTLGFMPVFMHPMTDPEWQTYNYKRCMANLGYER